MSHRRTGAGLVAAFTLLGCGGGGTDTDAVVLAKASPSGDGQSGELGAVLTNPLRVILTQGGNPISGRTVTWQAQSGVQLDPMTTTSGADGIASTVVTLPLFGSTRIITASAVALGSPQSFTVTANGAGLEVLVQVVNSEFLPSTFNLKAGGTVTFTWGAGAGPHNVTPVAPNTIPTSSNPAPPGTHTVPYSFQATFSLTGTYKFFCGVHGSPDAGMHGTITVIP